MGAGASSGVAAAVKTASVDEKNASVADLSGDDIISVHRALTAATPKTYTLYISDKGLRSMRILVFLAESQLLDHVRVVTQVKVPMDVEDDIKTQFADHIKALDQEGETWLPALHSKEGYMLDDDKIIEFFKSKHNVDAANLTATLLFEYGVFKDYQTLVKESHRLAGGKEKGAAKAWFEALDTDGTGDVSLEEMIQGLDLTRLLADARRGSEVNTTFDRWAIANEQVDALVVEKPDFVNGWRLRMVLGTISDDYDKIIESADKIIALKKGDPQALSIKAYYTKALGRPGYQEAMDQLKESSPTIFEAVDRLFKTVDKYWDKELSMDIPKISEGKMCIVALGSPADDDGTPRPRLMGTLNKTLEAAKQYPDADIFVTGAAVSSNMPEAIAMTKWLTARGVDGARITKEMKAMDTVGNYEYIAPMLRKRGITKVMLITVYYHLNRSSALADAVFEQRGLEIEVIGVAGESDLKDEKLTTRMGVERPASYRDVARACSLYEQADFESA